MLASSPQCVSSVGGALGEVWRNFREVEVVPLQDRPSLAEGTGW